MAITTCIPDSFKTELALGTHNFTASTGDTFKCALYTSSATLGTSTTAYSATNEVTGTGYSAGGVTIASVTPVVSSNTTILDFADAAWPSSSITANGALIYNSSKSNKAVAVFAFGADVTTVSGTLTLTWPTADSANAVIRIS